MSSGRVSEKTKRKILAASGNVCAFPSCSELIFDLEHETLIGIICHIAARSAGGPRFDNSMADTQRNSFQNLIVLCGKHHKIVDDNEDQYDTSTLLEMKRTHELQVAKLNDRGWISNPNTIVRQEPDGTSIRIDYWVNSQGRPQVYSEEQLIIVESLRNLYTEISKICEFIEMIPSLTDGTQIEWIKSQAVKLTAGKPSIISRLFEIFYEVEDIKFGDFIAMHIDGKGEQDYYAKRDDVVVKSKKVISNKVGRRSNPEITKRTKDQ